MSATRRSLLASLAGTMTLLAAGSWVRGEAQTPQPLPSPNAPSNQNAPTGFDGPDIMHPGKAPVNPLNQEQIAASVHKLYQLAGELNDAVEHIDLHTTFSLDFVKKAQQIEKLAKQIKDRVKG